MYYPSKFGCTLPKPKQKKKFKAKKIKGKKVKMKPNKPFKKKKFFKKKNKKEAKEAPKPGAKQTQKQDCRCWNCNEKGHFANECPRQINFAGTYSNELLEQIAGYDEVSLSDISSEDEILVLTYLSSSEDESDND